MPGALKFSLTSLSGTQITFRPNKILINPKLNTPSFAYSFFPSVLSPKKIDTTFVLSLSPNVFYVENKPTLKSNINYSTLPQFENLSVSPYSIPSTKYKAYYARTSFYASIDLSQYGKVNSTNTYKGINDRQTLVKHATYPPSNTSDFSFEVVGQNVDSSIVRYTVNSIFNENSPNENYIWETQSPQSTTTKTLYFLNNPQTFLSIPFVVGETIRIRNINNGYVETATVTNATWNSVSYSSTNLPPEISGTFIDSVTTLYKFENYNSATATQSITNYFSSIATPGRRGRSTFIRTSSYQLVPDLRNVSKFSFASPTVKSVSDNRSVNRLSFPTPTYKDVADLRSISKLSSSRKVVETRTTIQGISSYINPFKTQTVSIPDLRRSVTKISNVSQYRSDSNVSQAYAVNTLYKNYISVKGVTNLPETPNYVRSYKFVAWTDIRVISPPSKILIPLKAINVNTEVNTLRKKHIEIKEVANNSKDVYGINVSKYINNQIFTTPSNFGGYTHSYKTIVTKISPIERIERQKISQIFTLDLRDSRFAGKISIPLKAVAFSTRISLIQRDYPFMVFRQDPIRFTVNTIPKQAIKAISPIYNIQMNTLRSGGFVTVKDVPYKLSVNKFSRPIATISLPNYSIANITANVAQSTVSTRSSPTNPREVLYYVNLVPGIRNKAYYAQTSAYAPNTPEIYSVANIAANVAQSTVSTRSAPTNPREVLYYVNLIPGIRNKAYYAQTSAYAPNTPEIYPIANVSANIAQSTVSTINPPTSPREVLYYVNIAPGTRNKAQYIQTSSYAPNTPETYPVVNLSSNLISQSTVFTTTAPTSPREVLYYVNLAPGIRNKSSFIQTNQYAAINDLNIRRVLTYGPDHKFRAATIPINLNVNRLSFYSPLNNPNASEFRIEITGQNLDSSITNRYVVDSIFTENNPNESYLWNKQSIISSATKTLYFPNQSTQKIFAGDVIKVTNINSGYIDYVYVTSATTNSITYTGSNLIPEVSGTFIENGATVYPKFLSTSVGPSALINLNISVMAPGKNANKSFGYGQNYASSPSNVISAYNIRNAVPRFTKGDIQLDFSTKLRSVLVLRKDPIQLRIDNIDIQKIRNVNVFNLPQNYATQKLKSLFSYKDLPNQFLVYDMKRYDPDSSGVSPDFSLNVTDQSLNSYSNYYYDTDTIFIENNAGDSYVWTQIPRSPPTSQPTTKTLFFATQLTIRFKAGEKIRIRNITTGRTSLETVISCTLNSVTFSPTAPITEVANTVIDSGFTLYPQSSVRTTTAPTNVRENLYYSVIAPGLRGDTIYPQGTNYASAVQIDNTAFKHLFTNRTPVRSVYNANYLNISQTVRFKTGNFKRGSNGIQDPAEIKKPPVQFWS